MKTLLLTAGLLTVVACTKYSVRENPAAAVERPPETLKIALVGFYPFTSRVTGSYVSGNTRTTTFEASVDYSMDQKGTMPYGKHVKEFPVKETREIPDAEFKRIVLLLVSDTKRSGLEEMGHILDYDQKTKKYFLKVRDVDYYIFATHTPAFQTTINQNPLATIGSAFAFLFTFGIFPMDAEKLITSRFQVVDKNFQLVKEFKHQGSFFTRISWLNGNGPKGNTPYKQDFHFAQEFSDFLRTKK
ncbi:MAG: hypothetical protein HY042_10090 [Spirochaetia bacterium]|nr:hypothetical protein [Spirochaetia bacterium]